jgi:outer membrane receptor protein involved in Fe transport
MGYNIQNASLSQALRDYGRVSGRQIIFTEALVQGRSAPALVGVFPPDEALTRLLAGTGLRWQRTPTGAVMIIRNERDAQPLAQSVGNGPSGANEMAWANSADESAEILVTGTRIRRAENASPLIVSTRESLEDAGVTDMAGFTGGQNPGVAMVNQSGASNTNLNSSTTLDLRGLGADATLTLINGHRLAYDALTQGVDVSAIPLAAIDRIEVIADGASAVYGSDAVGGVVNVVLRRDYSGLRTTARFGASTDGGNVQHQYTGLTGARWTSGGFMIAGDYNRNTPIFTADRDYTRGLNGAQMLITQNSQVSAVIAGHQMVRDGVRFELDAQFLNRRMEKTQAFTVPGGPLVNGQITNPSVRSLAVTPSFHFELPSDWTASLEATHATSETILRSRAFTNSTETTARGVYDNRLTNVEVGAEGPLFQLPGGAVRLAVGGGYRSFGLDINIQQIVGGVTRTTRDGTEERGSFFAYGELALPLVGPRNRMPLLEALQLSAAVRYERYRGINDVATPKFGIVYAPHRDVTIKTSWGRSFKIPTLNQVNQLQAGGVLPASFFAPQPQPPLGGNATVLVLSGGSRELQEERARTWTTTIEVRPQIVEGLTLKASYFNVDYRDRISVPIVDTLSVLANPVFADFITLNPGVQLVNDIVTALPQAITNATGRPFNPAEVGAIVDARLRNTARERVRGIDFAADYRLDVGSSRIALNAGASYLDAMRQLGPGQPFVDLSGVIYRPSRWRGRLGGSWETGTTQVTAFVNYIGSVQDNRVVFDDEIGAFTTLDLSARVRTRATRGLLQSMEFRLTALNILNETPSIINVSNPASIPFDSTNQSAIGRFISLAVVKTW